MTKKQQGKAVSKKETNQTEASLSGYELFLESLKQQIQTAQMRAAVSVNAQLIQLYYSVGQAIVERQEQAGWGDAVLELLSKDLTAAFPDMKGLSQRNLYRMRSFYLAYRADGEIFATAVAKIPWGHNIVIIDKVKDSQERHWYVAQTLEHGWSRAILEHQIETALFHRQGSATTNFSQTLPAPQSDLARQILKDPYNFDFLSLSAEALERDLERGLLEKLREFLIELGTGFAFVGSQFHLEVAGQDFYLDLLFYHLRLRCFVVVDLKISEFQPEFAGKMAFYLAAVDDLLRHEHDQPSIGLILCKTKNSVIAEYTLRNSQSPIGVSEYKVLQPLPAELQQELPAIENLQKELTESADWNVSDPDQ